MLLFLMTLIDSEEDKAKFELIYSKYRNLMFYIANRILKDKSLAEDAVQEALIIIIQNLDKISEVSSHKTKGYIVAIIKNHSINVYNKKKKRPLVPIEEVEHMLFCEDELNIGDIDFEELGELGIAILQLPTIYRDIIILKYAHEMTNKEIASSLSISETNVRKRLERAKEKIQIILDKEH